MKEMLPYITAKTASYEMLKENAQHMRSNPTEAEEVLWKYLRNNQLGQKFRRQQIIGNYIVDFVSLSRKLIIEVDGKYHSTDEQREFDLLREQFLSSLGYRVIRFSNEEIVCNIEHTLERIKEYL